MAITRFKKGDRVRYSAQGLAVLRPARGSCATSGTVVSDPIGPFFISVRMDGLKNSASKMTERPLFNASIQEGVALGSCVMLLDDAIVYAGPIKGAPLTDGKLVLLHPDDFTKLKTLVDKHRH